MVLTSTFTNSMTSIVAFYEKVIHSINYNLEQNQVIYGHTRNFHSREFLYFTILRSNISLKGNKRTRSLFVFWDEFLSSIPPDNGANRALLYPQAGIPDLRGSRQGLKVSLFFTPTLFNPRGLNREGATTSVEKKAIRTQLGAAAHRGTRNFEI